MPDHEDDKYAYLNKISCETEVHLQVVTPTQAIRLKTRLIGVDPNMSVIVAMGNNNEWLAAKQYIREGQKVIVRLMSTDHPEANLIAFQSHIQKLMSVAGRWLLIDYPKEVQQLALREHRRLPVHIDASLIDPNTKSTCSSGHLSDLSIQGGAFIGEPIKSATKDKKYTLQVSVDGDEKSVPIVIKNTKSVVHSGSLVKQGFVIEEEIGKAKKFIGALLSNSLANS
ncbi:flagellar brake domain-containing protein [Psychromonas sp. KJ10-10]|uniref:flagellar brake domain-containing protein n=1 Tax=Psychromonas sp. KJ10-10 TaxID=3391823 RepID=UPI0039B4C17A